MPSAITWLALAAPWLLCAGWLQRLWSHAPEFAFGWAVFPLAGYLLWVRLAEAPSVASLPGPRTRAFAMMLAGVGAMLLVVGGLLLAPSPRWTTPMWLAVTGAAMVTAGTVLRAGGEASLREAVWPLAFAYTALPWPTRFEAPTIAALREANAWFAAEIVSMLGRPAVAHGALVETAGTWAGVEDACSGILALQTALMLGIFFGELRRLNVTQRAVLLVGAVVLALGVNLARTTWLVWLAAEHRAAEEHARAGQIELVAALAVVGLWCLWYGRGRLATADHDGIRVRVPQRWAVVALSGTVAIGVGVTVWYRLPAAGPPAEQGWSVSAGVHWRRVALPAHALEMLTADSTEQRVWQEPQTGRTAIVLLVRWDFDPALRYGAAAHGPEICLPMAGAEAEADLGTVDVMIEGVRLPLEWKRFRAGGEPFHTFTCLWDPTEARAVGRGALAAVEMTADRLARVWQRRKQFGLERVTVAFNRCPDDEEARRRVATLLAEVLQPQRGEPRT
jgi:exosortase